MTTYDLHRLGWHSFQQLCLTIVREVLGQTVESFLDAGDGGRDGAFSGTWRQSGSEDIFGQFVIQCKFTSSPNRRIRIADLGEELPKAKCLVDAGRCDSYVLLTNLGISGNQAEQIARAFRKVGVTHTRSLGVSWINQQIHESKRLRMLVPRVYGLGDLSQILDERCYAQARALLASLREDLARVVITNA